MSKRKLNLPPEIEAYSNTEQVAYLATKAFFRIGEDWRCSNKELMALLGNIGLVELTTLRTALEKLEPVPVPRERLARIKCLVTIYKAGVDTYGSAQKAAREMRVSRSGLPFQGKAPIAHMVNNGLSGIIECTKAFAGMVPDLGELQQKAS